MHIIKKLARGLSSYLFKLLIFVTAIVAALVFTFHSPKKIEKSLKDSGVYSTFVDSALKEAQKSSNNKGDSKIPIDDPAIKAAASKAFNPQLLQTSTESILNGTYDWLSGKVVLPDFRVDLRAAKRTFAQGVGQAAKSRLDGLPVCTTAQLQRLGSSSIDAFSAPCRPASLNVNQQAHKVVSDIASSKDFLGTPLLTAQNLPKNSRGKTVYDQLSKAPKIYKWVNASPWLLIGLSVLLGGITVLLYDSRRRGLRHISITLVSTGVLLLIISFVSSWLLNKAEQPTGKLGSAIKGSFQQTAIKGISSITNSIEHTLIWFGAIYLVAGAAVLVALHFTKPKTKPAADKTESPKPENSPKPHEPEHKAAKTLVQ